MSAAASGARILAVDDDPGLLRVARRVLAPTHHVDVAHCVQDALARLEELARRGARPYDIALVDVQMPDGDGYELNRRLKRLSPGTDVILMTGSTSHQDQKLFQALDDDVFYFLFKPFHARVLTALVERCLRIRRLQEENRSHLERLAADQEKARHIQRRLLPSAPLETTTWRLEARFRPCEEVSGDLFAVFPLADGSVILAVIDVIGHGLPAAMYGGMLRSTLDAARRLDPEPRAVFDRLFEGLDFFAGNSGATLFYGLLGAGGDLRYFSAGHPAVLLETASGIESLTSTGPLLSPLPLVGNLPRATAERRLAPGDRLLVYTDGIIEARSPEGGLYGAEALAARLHALRGQETGAALDALLAGLEEHCGGRPLEDDVTLLLAQCREKSAPEAKIRS